MSRKILVAAALATIGATAIQMSPAKAQINGERSNQRQGESSEVQPNAHHPGLPTNGNSRMEEIRRTSSGELTLSGTQRNRIKEAVEKSNLKRQSSVGFTISVGAAVPQQAGARDLPPAVAKAVPSKHPLQYVLVRDQLILLDKRTHRIVAILPGMA
ncbi:MAG TPA: DUF1236 domain-containing protein [Pseudolabrys sp.]|nr:DUF1236 domain-containing protein [Pseudolabrys sp.]